MVIPPPVSRCTAISPDNFAIFQNKQHFPPPDVANLGPIRSPEDWTCPA